MDFMTGLPPSPEGYDSIMVVVDHGLTKGVVLIPTTNFGLTARKMAQLYLDNIYTQFGLSESIISDRAKRTPIRLRILERTHVTPWN